VIPGAHQSGSHGNPVEKLQGVSRVNSANQLRNHRDNGVMGKMGSGS
jgi:hypothetical protein